MIRARRRSFYCSPVEYAEIAERARAEGMKVSPFVIACALAEDQDERPDTLLALTEEEQRTLYDRVAFLDRCARAMHEHLPASELSLFDALAFLERVASLRRRERE